MTTSSARVQFARPPTLAARLLTTARAGVVAFGRLVFTIRDYLFPAVFLVLVVTTQPEFPFGSVVLDRWMDAAGLCVAVLGETFRLLAVGSAEHIRRGGDRKHIAAERLIREGIFASTRNPLYLGDILIVTGLVIIANNVWWYALVLPGFLGVYRAIVAAEEDFLRRKFGEEYAAYCRDTNRLLPSPGALRRTLVNGAVDWRRAWLKEVGVICSWVPMALILLLGAERKVFGEAQWKALSPRVLLVLLAAVLGFRLGFWVRHHQRS